MNFRRGRAKDEPEINLVPLIDVLLVILIFLMVTTTYSKFAELQINLPEVSAEAKPDRPNEVNVAVDAGGQYVIEQRAVSFSSVESLSLDLRRAAGEQKDPVIVINADAKASHESVVRVMAAARMAGYSRVTFAAQSPTQ